MSQTMKTFIQFVSDKEPLRNAVDESTRCIIGIAEYEAIQSDAFRAGEISGMEKLTPELDEVLGLMPYQTAPLARAYRDAGIVKDLPRKVEREQAFILHKLINLVIIHGANWRAEFGKELEPVLQKAESNITALNSLKEPKP